LRQILKHLCSTTLGGNLLDARLAKVVQRCHPRARHMAVQVVGMVCAHAARSNHANR
jgi:hypothetical protein